MYVMRYLNAEVEKLECAVLEEEQRIQKAINARQIGGDYWKTNFKLTERLRVLVAMRDALKETIDGLKREAAIRKQEAAAATDDQ